MVILQVLERLSNLEVCEMSFACSELVTLWVTNRHFIWVIRVSATNDLQVFRVEVHREDNLDAFIQLSFRIKANSHLTHIERVGASI